jgi:hypothetical protein
MRRIKKHLQIATKNAKGLFKQSEYAPKYIHSNVPYFSQWESRDLVELIITMQLDGKDDPKWADSGAASKDEYAEWSWNGCGVACLKMILAATQDKVVPLAQLGKKATTYGVYKMPLHSSPGMFYKPFVTFIEKEFGLNGKAESALTISEIKQTISKGGYVIVSVTPEIRFSSKKPSKKGGHLVLVYGYDDRDKVLYLHNPSGFEGAQENVTLSESSFMQFFDHKGIIVFA